MLYILHGEEFNPRNNHVYDVKLTDKHILIICNKCNQGNGSTFKFEFNFNKGSKIEPRDITVGKLRSAIHYE